MAGTLHLGTSGFAYEEWRHGVFYPEGVSASRMLSHYASVFESVEINYTFRQFPSEATLRTWLTQTPETFRFALKANQRKAPRSRPAPNQLLEGLNTRGTSLIRVRYVLESAL